MIAEQQVVRIAYDVIQSVRVGCLATVAPDGQPYQRYLAVVPSDESLQWLYSISAQATRKVEHLREHRNVSWIFGSPPYADVVTLHGRAVVQPTVEIPDWVYNLLIETASVYAVGAMTDPHYHYEAIVTQVEAIELLSPGRGLTAPQRVAPLP